MVTKRSALVICPGRGSYLSDSLGYLQRHHADQVDFLHMVDGVQRAHAQIPVTELDQKSVFSEALHGRGDHASMLIYSCALADYLSLMRVGAFDIVAITGNSMGWYLALTAAGSLSLEAGAGLVTQMGAIMTAHGYGGQIIYPLVDEDWRLMPSRQAVVAGLLEAHDNLSLSIDLGGYVVLAGDEAGLARACAVLPKHDVYPLRLSGHAAFHSAHVAPCAERAQMAISCERFTRPECTLIDGQGHIWTPYNCEVDDLYAYTLGTQITQSYNFSQALRVGIKEFAPEVLILLGPGTSLGAPIAQVLIAENWQNIDSKQSFKRRQNENPVLLSMAIDSQRRRILHGTAD